MILHGKEERGQKTLNMTFFNLPCSFIVASSCPLLCWLQPSSPIPITGIVHGSFCQISAISIFLPYFSCFFSFVRVILREEDSNQYYLPKTTAFIVLFILFYAICLTFSVFAFFLFWSLFVLLIVSFSLSSFGSYKLYFCFLRVTLENFTYILSPTKSKVNNNFLLFLLFSRSVVSDSLQPHGLQHARLFCSLLLLSRFSRVRLCATPQTAVHQAPPSLGFSRQEHWSGLPFPSPMHESEK